MRGHRSQTEAPPPPPRTCPSPGDQGGETGCGTPAVPAPRCSGRHHTAGPHRPGTPFPPLLSHCGGPPDSCSPTKRYSDPSSHLALVLQHHNLRVSGGGGSSQKQAASARPSPTQKPWVRVRVSAVPSLPLIVSQIPARPQSQSHSSYLWATDSGFLKREGQRGRKQSGNLIPTISSHCPPKSDPNPHLALPWPHTLTREELVQTRAAGPAAQGGRKESWLHLGFQEKT